MSIVDNFEQLALGLKQIEAEKEERRSGAAPDDPPAGMYAPSSSGTAVDSDEVSNHMAAYLESAYVAPSTDAAYHIAKIDEAARAERRCSCGCGLTSEQALALGPLPRPTVDDAGKVTIPAAMGDLGWAYREAQLQEESRRLVKGES